MIGRRKAGYALERKGEGASLKGWISLVGHPGREARLWREG